MTDFVRDLETELVRAARRRARPTRRRFAHPPALLAAALVALALLIFALAPRPAAQRARGTGTASTTTTCLFPDVAHLLRDGPCTSDPFTRHP
jgi:ferric-dicitrate binding protein FerR (iron transport regulator)